MDFPSVQRSSSIRSGKAFECGQLLHFMENKKAPRDRLYVPVIIGSLCDICWWRAIALLEPSQRPRHDMKRRMMQQHIPSIY